MSLIEESVEVRAPLPAVYEQWTGYEEFPRFMRGVVAVARTEPDPVHHVVDGIAGRDEFGARTTEVVPQERIAWSNLSGAVRQSGVVTFHRVAPEVTRVMLQLEFEPDGVLERVADALGFVDRRVIDDLADFRDRVEAAHPRQP